MKRGIICLGFFVLMFSLLSVSANFKVEINQSDDSRFSELPFETDSLSIDLTDYSMEAQFSENYFDGEVFHHPLYSAYLNEIYFGRQSSRRVYSGNELSNRSSSLNFRLTQGRTPFSELDFENLDILNEGKNELIIFTKGVTINENREFIKSHIVNQYTHSNHSEERVYERSDNGSFVPCHISRRPEDCGKEAIDEGDCENQVIKDDCSLNTSEENIDSSFGPTVGVKLNFNLTQEQINSGDFSVKNISFDSVIIGVPDLSLRMDGDLTQGRRIFLEGESRKANESYSLYFNDNFIRNVTLDSAGNFREVIKLQEEWIDSNDLNKVFLKSKENDLKFGYPVFNKSERVVPDESEEERRTREDSKWSAGLWLNDTYGNYGDKISVYGYGLEPNREYTLRIRYQGIPGGNKKVTTNKLGEFEIDNFEISPPVITEAILHVKDLFSEKENKPSSEKIEKELENLPSVTVNLEFSEGGGIGTDFKLCDNASGRLKSLYCAD